MPIQTRAHRTAPSRRPARRALILLTALFALAVAAPVAAFSPARTASEAAVAAGLGQTASSAVQAALASGVVPSGVTSVPAAATASTAKRPAASAPVARPATQPAKTTVKKTTPKQQSASKPKTTSYSGRNHVWIPSLGVSRSTTFFSCSRSTPPANYMYRWGCAGSNNVYLFGHAYSVFKPLHDAYASGRLRKGMKVVYADSTGRVRTYAVIWWRLTTPDNGGFAYASQSSPSMTLQTCYGANSQYRLIVRLSQVT